MRAVVIGLLLACLPLCPGFSKEPIVIAAFGDSLFAGYGLKPEEAFPAQLEQKLKADGYDARVINDGISGDTTADGAARIADVLAQKPTIVIVGLGANDMLRGLPPEQVRTNLDTILRRLQEAGIRNILVAGQKAPLSYGMKYAQGYNPIFCELAKQYGAACYPTYMVGVYGHADLTLEDGMHPNAKGVKIILDKIYPSLKPLLFK